MRRLVGEALTWLPPVAMMVLIFALSSLSADGEDHGLLHLASRKLAHFGEYALLLALWWRALATRVSERRALAIGLGIAIAYAITDELHQTLVDGRMGRPLDVGVDTAGALAAGAVIFHLRLRRDSAQDENAHA